MRREVILSAGAVNTPKLLLLSGVGDRAQLEPLGVDVVHHNPHVGRGLADGVYAIMQWSTLGGDFVRCRLDADRRCVAARATRAARGHHTAASAPAADAPPHGRSTGLLAVGGILSLTLGISGLILARNQKLEVIWNKRFAAQLLCWIFISKGVANSLRSVGYETELWRVILYAGHFTDQIFGGLIMLLALIFPVPILRTRKQFKIGIGAVLVYSIISLGAAVFISINTPLASFLGLYLVPGFIWTLVYLKFRFMSGHEDNEEVQGVADVAILLLILMIGHILFRWVGLPATQRRQPGHQSWHRKP